MNKATMQGLNKRLSSHTGITLRIMVAAVLLLTFVLGTVSLAAPNAPTGESSLGDRVWHDLNNNGQQDLGEPGINDVNITLYLDDGDSVFDPGPTGDQVDTETFDFGQTTTATNGAVTGYYNYNKITADGNEFWVVIDADNFGSGKPLEGFLFSSELFSAFPIEGEPGNAADPLRMFVPTSPGQFRITIDTADFGFWKPELNLSITPGTATNKVGDPHEFVITVLERASSGANVGNMVPKQGATPTVTVTDSANAAVTPIANTSTLPLCTVGTNSNGQCAVTINSSVADVYTASASLSATYGTGGANGTVTISRQTGTALNTAAGGTGNAAKTYVNLRLSITPGTATNAVNAPHTFKVKVEEKIGDGAWTVVAGVSPTVAYSPTPSTPNAASAVCGPTDGNGECEVTINSTTATVITASASLTRSVSGQSITRQTGTALNTAAGGTGNASKTYVNLRLSITPGTATNAVNAPHTFKVKVEEKIGNGAWTPVAGVSPTVAYSPTPSTPNAASAVCGPTDGNGECEVTINSTTATVITASASLTRSVSGQSITRQTGTALNTAAGGTGNASKTYVNLRLSITPGTATNAVNAPHTFKVKVEEKIGNGAWTPVAGVSPTVAYSPTPSTPNASSAVCGPTDGNGECEVTINSTTATVITASASLTRSVSGQSITRQTGTALNTAAGGTGNASKTYVNLRLSITPGTATNAVNAPHTFKVKVEEKIGNGAWTPVAGVSPTVAYSPTPSTPNASSAVCGPTDGNGECEVTINSTTATVITASASLTRSVSGQSITRQTGTALNTAAGGTGNASKTYVNLRISIDPLTATNPVGAPHTFKVKVEEKIGNGAWTPVAGVSPTVAYSPTPSTPNASSAVCGPTDGNGECEVTINSTTATVITASASLTRSVSGQSITRQTGTALNTAAGGSANAQKTYLAATLGDKVWWDIDKDGIQDSGEPGIKDVTVNLFVGASTTVYRTTQTNASGIYSFVNLPNDTYRIEIPNAEFTGSGTLVDWLGSPQDAGGNTIDSDANPTTHVISNVALALGQNDPTNDFGFFVNTEYTITKTTNAVGSQRLGDEIKFTIQIKNLGASYLAVVPLEDTYNTRYLTYQRAEVGGVALVADGGLPNSGTLTWNDVTSATATGQLAPNATISIDVFFNAAGDTTDTSVNPTNPDWPNTKNVARVVNPKGDPDGPTGPLPEDEPLPTKQDDALVQIINPTAVSVASSTLAVDPANGTVTMRWQTVSEADIAGFNVMRRVDGGAPEQINDQLILAQNPGQPVGSWYTFMDSQASVGSSTTYLLQFIMADGRVVNHELDTVFVGYTLFMPLVIR